MLMGISQANLASAAGLSPQQIHKYETSASRLTAGRLAQFASILKVPISYFYDDLDADESPPTRISQLLADAGAVEMLVSYSALPKRLRPATLAYVRIIVSETADAELRTSGPETSLPRTLKTGDI
ncbi:MAG: helix-turn-helix domain-containing protein [Hyphomicrobiaceae bacterium]